MQKVPIYVFWEIWKARNKIIFENQEADYYWIIMKVCAWPDSQKIDTLHTKDVSYRLMPPPISFPGFFDGAAQLGRCGCGAWLSINNSAHYRITWFAGVNFCRCSMLDAILLL